MTYKVSSGTLNLCSLTVSAVLATLVDLTCLGRDSFRFFWCTVLRPWLNIHMFNAVEFLVQEQKYANQQRYQKNLLISNSICEHFFLVADFTELRLFPVRFLCCDRFFRLKQSIASLLAFMWHFYADTMWYHQCDKWR